MDKTERNQKIKELQESGLSTRKIAAQFGISAMRVRQILKKLNGIPLPAPIRKPGYNTEYMREYRKRKKES